MPLPIPEESDDELQNERESDDGEYILSETEEEIIAIDTDNEQVNGNQTAPRARDNTDVVLGKRN